MLSLSKLNRPYGTVELGRPSLTKRVAYSPDSQSPKVAKVVQAASMIASRRWG